MSLTQEIASQVLPVVATGVSGLLAAIVTLLFARLKDHVQSQRARDVIDRVKNAADVAVRDVSNTMVERLRRKDGTLDPTARADLKAAAVDKVRELIGQITEKKVMSTLGFESDAELVRFIGSHVESGVWMMKLQQEAAKNAPPAPPVQVKA